MDFLNSKKSLPSPLVSPHPFFHPFKKVKVKNFCPHCGSVFVNKKECEACGFQFWVDLLGEPFGGRSFFEIQYNYERKKNFIEKILPQSYRFSKKKHKRYLRHLRRRFDILSEYLFNKNDTNKKRKKYFLFEFKVLIEKIPLEGGSISFLEKIENCEKHSLFPILIESIENAKLFKKEKTNFKEYLKNSKLFSICQKAILPIKALIVGVIVTLLALGLYPFFLK